MTDLPCCRTIRPTAIRWAGPIPTTRRPTSNICCWRHKCPTQRVPAEFKRSPRCTARHLFSYWKSQHRLGRRPPISYRRDHVATDWQMVRHHHLRSPTIPTSRQQSELQSHLGRRHDRSMADGTSTTAARRARQRLGRFGHAGAFDWPTAVCTSRCLRSSASISTAA